MTPWTEAYSQFFSLHVFTNKDALTTSEVDEIVIDLMNLMERVINFGTSAEIAQFYKTVLPAIPFMRAKASVDTAARLGKIADVGIDIVNMSKSVKK